MKLTILLVATSALAQTPPVNRTFGLLKDRREQFEFIPYTAEQKTRVAQTVLNMMQIYVNRQSKLDNYGKEKSDIDPLPKAQDMLNKAASLTEKDFHYQMLDIFTPLRDLHTLYYVPGPHSCMANVKAVEFTITEENGREQIVVEKFTKYEEVKQLSPEHTKISIGDELLSVDGQPIQEYIQSRLFLAGGANEFGGKRKVLNRMSIRPGAIDKTPTEDQTTFRFKKFPSGEEYTVVLPWVTSSRDECYPAAKKVMDLVKAGTPVDSIPNVVQPAPTVASMLDFVNPRIKHKKAVFGDRASIDVIKADDIIDYAIYKPESKNLGIIFLKSFNPEDGNVYRILTLIRKLLSNELKDTRAVLFDIRDNGGGIITLAETIPQFLKKDIQPLQSRAINNRINKNIFNSRAYGRDQWTDAINATPERSTYTNPVQFTTDALANRFPPVYTKPAAILNNAECFSACDLFSAMFQDNQVGPVFGEDGRTGAGGANIVQMNNFFPRIDPDNFPDLPFVDKLPERARPNISLGWLQSVRVRQNAGKLIEDLGIVSEKIIRPSQSDILPDTKTYSVYDRIADILAPSR